MAIFVNPNDPGNVIIRSKIREWMIAYFILEPSIQIDVQELKCADAGCVDMETKITVTTEAGNQLHYRVHKPIVYVRKIDIAALQKRHE